jgi:hypothetical protein
MELDSVQKLGSEVFELKKKIKLEPKGSNFGRT